MHRGRLLAVAVFTLLVSQLAFGASFIVPTDRELVDLSNAIVIATATTSYPIHVANNYVDTVFEFRVEEVIKGDINANVPLQLVEMGGNLDGQYDLVPDSPRYAVGERALIFVGTNNRGENSTWGMILGKFNFVHDLHGRKLLLRGANEGEIFGWDACDNRHEEATRSEPGFLNFVRAAACGRSASENYLVPRSEVAWRQPSPNVNAAGFHADDYQDRAVPAGGGLRSGGIRWRNIFDQPGGGGSITFVVVGIEAGVANSNGGISNAMGAWNGNGQSNVNYIRGAASSTTFSNNGIHSIHLDDNVNVPTGAVGFARMNCSGAACSFYAFDGAQMATTTDADVAVRPLTSQSTYEGVLVHEFGHTLSIRHSNERAPSTGSAAMNSICCPTGGAILATWDSDAIATIYNPNPGGSPPPPCTPPSISVQPASQTITSGNSATMTVTATGTAPLSFQWFIGPSGTVTTPTGTNSASLTVSPTSTTQYWVRVTGQCAPVADSAAATITVNPAVCTPVAIFSQPVDQSVTAGGTVQLTVGFTGTAPVTVTWFRGAFPDASQNVGSGQTIFSPQITQPTQFWARLTNCSGANTVNTRTLTVNVATSCAQPSGINASATSTSISPGQQVTLGVFPTIGTQPFTFQWFVGVFPDAANPIPGGTASSVTVSPTTTTSYWARVTNTCGNGGSNTVTVTVNTGPGCTPPSITAQPVGDIIVIGTSTTLSVAAAGTGTLHFQWFQGNAGDTSTPVGSDSASFTTPALTAITSYWVRVTGQCTPTADSTTATLRLKSGRPRAVRH